MKIYYGTAPETFGLVRGKKSQIQLSEIEAMPKEIKLAAGKNDTASFQIILTASERFALNIAKQPWFSQNSKRRNIRLSAELPFELGMNHIGTVLCDDGYLRGDVLLTKSVVEAEDEEVLSVYCEISVPKDAQKGSYNGKIKLFESFGFERESLVGEINIELRVYDYCFPENKDNGFHLDLWQHPSNIARYYGVELWSDEHFVLLDKYCASLGRLGVKCVTVIASEMPWNGQGCQSEVRYDANLFEYSMIPVTRKCDGRLEYDFSIMQRYIDLCAKHGIDECISVYGLVNVWDNKTYGEGHVAADYPDGVRVRVFDEKEGVYDYIRTAEELDCYIRALESYFIETDQNDILRIAADEPADIEAYRKSLEHIKSVAPSFKYKTAINHAEFVNEFGKDIYDFAPYISAMYSEYDALMQFKAEMPEKRFLYYVCCCPEIPNSFLRSLLTDGYYIGILAAMTGMDGFLRWSYTCWTDDPNNDLRFGPFPVGDLNYVYPSPDGNPWLSLRWKALYRGIRYYVLLKAAAGKGLDSAVEAAYNKVMLERDVKKLYSNWDRNAIMSVNPDDYREFAEMLMSALEE
ncbi:MAG: DUF4091 domain-containing protein [Ruminococcaceae bacterium]|nr:DUF4091 domain-containing protein [Oscillospiraceae bacterium]